MAEKSSPAALRNLTFAPFDGATTCAPATINWTYTGPDDFVMLVVASILQGSQDPSSQDSFGSIITSNISTTAQSLKWSSVDIAGGPYVLSAVGTDIGAMSPPFFVTSGTDTSCVVAVNGTVVASSSTQTASASGPPATPATPVHGPLYTSILSQTVSTHTTQSSSTTFPVIPSTLLTQSSISTIHPDATNPTFYPPSSSSASALRAPASVNVDASVVGSILGGAFGFATLSIAMYRLTRRWRMRKYKHGLQPPTAQTKLHGKWVPLPSAPPVASVVADEERALIRSYVELGPGPLPKSYSPPPRTPSPDPVPRQHPIFGVNPHLQAPRRHKSVPRPPKLQVDTNVVRAATVPAPKVAAVRPQTRESGLSIDALTDTLALSSVYELRHQRYEDGAPASPVPSSATSRMYHGPGESP
ncbi:hypothetical protein C8Q80DRAFT_824248 [Daedaleopsis nitida]|nr:hypothetical protein C8Q80DRAFT_824248 [Daedaleopsis nitida]